jgi:uncharacterized membrane protein (DUF4010 family)
LAISLGLGLLVGLQRERTENRLGGIRTFPLYSLLGTFAGFLANVHGGWVILAGFLAVLGTLLLSNFFRSHQGRSEFGQTTEVAALVTFAIGAYLVNGDRSVAIIATGIVVVLLHLKGPMHYFVEKMGREDMAGIMQFVVISLIVLPLLPDRGYGPFEVLNPFDIWRMVVLIVGMSLAGYIAYKFLGQNAGILLGGTLGGLISSTATTVSYSRRTRQTPKASRLAVIIILIASTIAYVRVLVEIAVVTPTHFKQIVLPVAVMLAWMIVISGFAYFVQRAEREEIPSHGNPAQLKSALVFGVIYAFVLLAVAAAKQWFGESALYAVSIISGLTDMDAITLSLSRMVETRHLEAEMGWRLILVASLSNLVFKGILAAVLGGPRFAARIAIFFAVAIGGGLAILGFWR